MNVNSTELNQRALRRLSVDVANLSNQLAVHQAGLEIVAELLPYLTPEAWVAKPDPDGEGEVVTVPADEAQTVLRILSLLRDLM